jgi:hypothetical protein
LRSLNFRKQLAQTLHLPFVVFLHPSLCVSMSHNLLVFTQMSEKLTLLQLVEAGPLKGLT